MLHRLQASADRLTGRLVFFVMLNLALSGTVIRNFALRTPKTCRTCTSHAERVELHGQFQLLLKTSCSCALLGDSRLFFAATFTNPCAVRVLNIFAQIVAALENESYMNANQCETRTAVRLAFISQQQQNHPDQHQHIHE